MPRSLAMMKEKYKRVAERTRSHAGSCAAVTQGGGERAACPHLLTCTDTIATVAATTIAAMVAAATWVWT